MALFIVSFTSILKNAKDVSLSKKKEGKLIHLHREEEDSK